MKIVIVLCSLATFAIAVPVLQENVFESSFNNQPLSTKRERKSPVLDITPGLSPEYGIDKVLPHSSKKLGQGPSVGTKSFRRPIIIKRKLGYHVYRDSDEEMAYAEPGEKCTEQVKFKLCDPEPASSSTNGMKSPLKCLNNYKTENEMENSIKMARKAVEHLQKDLKRMENFSPKMANPHIEDIESNTGLHHDIEIAREALEHIEQNFESVNLKVNKVNELQIPKSQEVERLTRWREAIENIHKNFEIVKNIEDALKTDNQFSLFRSDNQKAVELEEPTNTELQFHVHNKFTNDNLENNDEVNNEDKTLKSASNKDETEFISKTENIDNINKDVANDMFLSLSENREKKVQLHSDSLKSEMNYKDASITSDASEIESTNINQKYANDDSKWQFPKSVPELQSDPMLSTTLNDDITDDQYSQTQEVSMRSSESQNEKLQLNDYQEEPKYSSTRLDIATDFDDIPAKFLKSVPEMQPCPSEFMPSDKEHITYDQQSHSEVASMRSSTSQNEKLQLNEYQEEPKQATSRLDLENNSDDTTSQSYKSVPETNPFQKTETLPLEKGDIANDEESHKTEASMRSSGKQNEKMQSNENQEVHELLTMGLDNEHHPEERTWKYSESVPELAHDSMVSMPTEEIVITDDPHAHTEEASMRSSASQNEKLELNEYREEPKLATSRLDIENNSDDITSQSFKSVPEMKPFSIEALPLEKGDITNDEEFHKTEASIRSSGNQNDKMQTNENEEVYERLSMGLDDVINPEGRTWQYSKSVPELAYDSMLSMPTEEIVITDDLHAHTEEASMRSSDSQNEKLQLNDYHEEPKFASTSLDIENNSDDTTGNFFKSVPELQPYPSELMTSSKERITNDQQSHREEVSMRSSDSQNEKIQSSENHEKHELLPMGLDIEHHPEDRTWQYSKSVPELAYDSMASMPTEELVITDDPHALREEVSMRSSESQNEKFQLNDYQEEPKFASTRLDIENNSDDNTDNFFKSVPELQPYPSEIMSLSKERITNDQQSHRKESSMRSSDSQSNKIQSIENQEVHELLPLELEIEHHPEERRWQDSKSVPELVYDSVVSMPTGEVVITDDPNAHREEVSMRSSESQNNKLKLNDYQEEPKFASTRLDIENNSDDTTGNFFKSVPELQLYPSESMPSNKEHITNDQQAYREELSMRSSDSQSEKMQTLENQGVHELLPFELEIEHHPEERTWQDSKFVPELAYDSMLSMPTEEVVIADGPHAHREEASMRSSESQNEKIQSSDNHEKHELLPMGLDIEHHPEDRTWQNSKSVPELVYDSVVSMPTGEVVITDDPNAHREEVSIRSSEGQNNKLKLNDYHEEPKFASTTLDIVNNSDDTTGNFFKSVPELQLYPSESMPSNKEHITNDQQAYREELSMRSSDSQSEKMQTLENQGVHELLPFELEIEHHPEERTWQDSKFVPELAYDSMLSMPTEEVLIANGPHVHREEASMRSSESQNEKIQSSENHEVHELLPMGLDIEHHPEDRTWQNSKSVPELIYDSMPTEEVVITDAPHAHAEETSIRSSESQDEKLKLNDYQEEPKFASTKIDIENNSDYVTAKFFKSVPELQPYPSESMPSDKKHITNDQQSHREEANMRSSDSQNEQIKSNEYNEEPKYASTRLDIENNSDGKTTQFFKSVPELAFNPTISIPPENVVSTDDGNVQKEEASVRSSESQNEKLQLYEYKEEPKYATRLDVENNSDDKTAQSFKSVPEVPFDPTLSMPTENVVSNNDQNVQKEKTNMRSSEIQNELQLSEYQEEPRYASTRLDIETSSDDAIADFFKSVPELQPFPIESLPLEKGDIINDQQSHKKEASMRSSENQNEKLQSKENQEVYELLPMGLDIERNSEEPTGQYSKSVPELRYDTMLSMPTEKIVSADNHQANKEETSMRLSVSQNEQLQLNENQKAHEPLMIRLDMTNHPEDLNWPFSKSVPELPYDPMLSMPSDNVEITNEHHFLNEGNMRLSQNQNERTQLDENHGLLEFLPTKLGDARLSQTQNERQQIYFNHHYEPFSSRLDFKNNYEDNESSANKLRFNYIHNPTKEQTAMRLSQNQNDNTEIQYPSTSFGLSNDMNRDDNVAHVTNDFMSVAQPQHLHENRNPMLRSSNERQYLSHNFKTLPEYKMLPQASQFEFSNGQNAHNEHINMRINEEQSRDPEPMENQYIHNPHSMRWNTENHQDHSPNTFKSNFDFDHTLHKSNEFGNEQFVPHEASKTVNTLEYRTRPQLFSDHILDDTQSSRWFQTKQHNDHFANYYKTIPEVQEEYSNPHFREHLRRVAVNHRLNDADTFNSHDYPSSRARLHDHMQKYHQEMSSNTDSSMERGMHMSMREPFAKSDTEFNNMQFNHPHGTPRFGAGLPVAGVSPGAVGVYPTGNAGGCGIPLLLSCSPSVISGRPNIAGPIFKSVDENFKYYIKRDAKNIEDVPNINGQKTSLPHSHGTGVTHEI